MFINEVQPKPISPGHDYGRSSPLSIAMPAPGYTVAMPHPHAKPSSRPADRLGWASNLWSPRNKVLLELYLDPYYNSSPVIT